MLSPAAKTKTKDQAKPWMLEVGTLNTLSLDEQWKQILILADADTTFELKAKIQLYYSKGCVM